MDNFLNKVSKICYNKKQGGRVINNYLRFLKSKVNNIVRENEEILRNTNVNLNNDENNVNKLKKCKTFNINKVNKNVGRLKKN